MFLLDPPYTPGRNRMGSGLYRHWEVDHERLLDACSRLQGDFLVTSDDAPEIHTLAARHGLEVRRCQMKGSSHRPKSELLIGRNLGGGGASVERTGLGSEIRRGEGLEQGLQGGGVDLLSNLGRCLPLRIQRAPVQALRFHRYRAANAVRMRSPTPQADGSGTSWAGRIAKDRSRPCGSSATLPRLLMKASEPPP